MRTTYICPWCFASNDCHDVVDNSGATPKEGDVLLCFYCAKPGVLHGGASVLPTPEEALLITADDRIATTIAAVVMNPSAHGAVDMVRKSVGRG